MLQQLLLHVFYSVLQLHYSLLPLSLQLILICLPLLLQLRLLCLQLVPLLLIQICSVLMGCLQMSRQSGVCLIRLDQLQYATCACLASCYSIE